MKLINWFWNTIISLRFAVLVIVGLAVSLATGTFLESYYDTHTASFFVYRSFWFKGLLCALGLNILAVGLSRYPWRKSQIPFLMAHVGILTLLAGSFLTQKYGIDGQIHLREGETGSRIEFDDEVLSVADGRDVDLIRIPWVPPMIQARELDISKFGLRIDRYIAHADPEVAFRTPEKGEDTSSAALALKLKIEGGPMRISQEF